MHFSKMKRRRKVPSNDTPGAHSRTPGGALQGEGNYDAAREFNAAERSFVQSGKVAAAARAAAPKSDAEQREMLDAEAEGRSRAREDYPPPPEASPGGAAALKNEPSKDAPRRRR